MNLVVHRQNLERLPAMIALAEDLEVDRLEIAHVQYYGWALRNREALLPTRGQWERSLAIITAARDRLKGRMRVDFVAPDYYAKYPKACMGGWGRGVILIDPAGRVALSCRGLDSGLSSTTSTHARCAGFGKSPRRFRSSAAKIGCRAVPQL
jgi:pyrroloquinoline quinone biosynthesis protein E